MATSCKAQRERSHSGTPKLLPRPTAASAARAARNATNRNLTLHAQRQSPTRSMHSLVKGRSSTPTSQNNGKNHNSKTDLKRAQSPNFQNCSSEEGNFSPDRGYANLKGPNNYFNMDIMKELNSIDGSESKGNYESEENGFKQTSESKIKEYIKSKQKETKYVEKFKQDFHCPSGMNTPSVPGSRPQTPKNWSSRPQTPRVASRPNTPARSLRSNANSNSRPNTPRRPRSASSRPRTPGSGNVQCARMAIANPIEQGESVTANNCDDVKSNYEKKQKEFLNMKKELDFKQRAVLKLYEHLHQLRDRMVVDGIIGPNENTQQQDLVVFNVSDWAVEEVTQLCRDTVLCSTKEITNVFETIKENDDGLLSELIAGMVDIPSQFSNLCIQAFTSRQEVIDWIKEIMLQNEDGGGETMQKIAKYNAQGLELCEMLRKLKNHTDEIIESATQFSKRIYYEKCTLISTGEKLIREVYQLQSNQSMDNNQSAKFCDTRTGIESTNTKIREGSQKDFEEERSVRVIKDKLSVTESQLRAARIRINKMDRQLREAEASITSLTGTVKTLEDQSRQRETQLESRARKLRESLKTNELSSNQLIQQRNALQNEVQELQTLIENMTAKHKDDVQHMTNDIKQIKCVIEEQRQQINKEMELKKAAEKQLTEIVNNSEQLQSKLIELENNKPNPELPTEREMDLWAELQATKETINIMEEEVTMCKREKVHFLETLTKIADSDNKIVMQQKLAAELLSKEEIINKMQKQLRELSKNLRLNEQKVLQYEHYVHELQTHNCAIATNHLEGPEVLKFQELQKEVMKLKMELIESSHRIEELSDVLMQKDQLLDQQDKTARSQAKVIKVREELINMLKNKETEQSRELATLQQDLERRMKIVEDVNKQIAAKAEEIQELFTTLETKQQQIHRLEKIVLNLEEQQRRAQAQRVRNEEKISALEHELATGGSKRERKFIFF